jgi:hypothetical protein
MTLNLALNCQPRDPDYVARILRTLRTFQEIAYFGIGVGDI